MLQAHGYVRKHFLMNDAELAAAKEQLAQVAAAKNATLVEIFVEDVANSPEAFESALSRVLQSEDRLLIVPTADHLDTDIGNTEVRKRLQANGITIISGDD